MAIVFFSVVFLFVISLASNATPFFGASYTLLATTILFGFGVTIGSFGLVVAVSATGVSIGKLVLYAGGLC